jgi:uncharacterized RDD family membrane protein YckC
MDYDDRMTISTPEGVTMEVTLAGLGSRVIAATIDGVLQFGILMAIAFVISGGLDFTDPQPPKNNSYLVAIAIVNVVMFVIFFFYYVFFETLWSGQSPGKRGAGLRVVHMGGQPIDLRASAIRNIMRLVDVLPTSYGVGSVAVLASKHNQRLGDMVAGTIVIREAKAPKKKAGTTDPYALTVPEDLARDLSTWDVSGISAAEVATVRRFLERRNDLGADARERIARDMADKLWGRVPGVPSYIKAEQFLELLSVAKGLRG